MGDDSEVLRLAADILEARPAEVGEWASKARRAMAADLRKIADEWEDTE